MSKNLTQAEKKQIAFEEGERELSQMREEMWDLLKKVTTFGYESTHEQLDDIVRAGEMAKDIKLVMQARSVLVTYVELKKQGKI